MAFEELYFALVLFRRRMAGTWSGKRLAGAAACVLLFATGGFAPGWLLEGLTVAVLVAVLVAERVAALRRIARGDPSPLERLRARR